MHSMMRSICCIVVFICCFQLSALAGNGKPAHRIFIDTDGALDDFRAINMLLAGKDFIVSGITCSQGTLPAGGSFQKVSSLLSFYRQEEIPVGRGKSIAAKLPAWSSFAQNIAWADAAGTLMMKDALQILEEGVGRSKEPVTLLALGSLNTYSQWLKNTKHDHGKIAQIVWYNEPDLHTQFNYLLDTTAYNEIRNMKIPLVIVSKGPGQLTAGATYVARLKQLNNVYAKRITDVLENPAVKEKIQEGHSQLWDDLVPLYLAHPGLFHVFNRNGITHAVLRQDVAAGIIYDCIARIFGG